MGFFLECREKESFCILDLFWDTSDSTWAGFVGGGVLLAIPLYIPVATSSDSGNQNQYARQNYGLSQV
jgi:hypothetical protein